MIRVDADFSLTSPLYTLNPTKPITVKYLLPEEEIAYGPCSWLWDYLRRSGTQGFFLPLSGMENSRKILKIIIFQIFVIFFWHFSGFFSNYFELFFYFGNFLEFSRWS